jgi:hypothetical protein
MTSGASRTKFDGKLGKPLLVSVRPAALDRQLLIVVAEGAQPLPETIPSWTTSARPLAEGGDPVALYRLRSRNTLQQRHPGGCENETARRRDTAFPVPGLH